VDTLRAVIRGILSEATVDHFWPERRVVMANAHAGGHPRVTGEGGEQGGGSLGLGTT